MLRCVYHFEHRIKEGMLQVHLAVTVGVASIRMQSSERLSHAGLPSVLISSSRHSPFY